MFSMSAMCRNNGELGLIRFSWDALGPADEKVKDEDDTTNGNRTGNGADEVDEEGRIWRVQAHARSSITCMKVDPISGSGVSTLSSSSVLQDSPLCGYRPLFDVDSLSKFTSLWH